MQSPLLVIHLIPQLACAEHSNLFFLYRSRTLYFKAIALNPERSFLKEDASISTAAIFCSSLAICSVTACLDATPMLNKNQEKGVLKTIQTNNPSLLLETFWEIVYCHYSGISQDLQEIKHSLLAYKLCLTLYKLLT